LTINGGHLYRLASCHGGLGERGWHGSLSTYRKRFAEPIMSKKTLSERDICTKFITPALAQAGWDVQVQVREQVYITKGRGRRSHTTPALGPHP